MLLSIQRSLCDRQTPFRIDISMLDANTILRDRYQLDRQLGKNAGRQTWLARDLEQDEPVVVKLLTFGGDVQ
nr:hypothetical protein [Pseudanabaena sp. PCC 6802]